MFVKLLWYDDIGRSRATGRVFGIVSQALMVFTFLKVYGISFKYWQIALLIFGWFISEVFLGWIYTKLNFLRVESDLYNEQNDIMIGLKDKKI